MACSTRRLILDARPKGEVTFHRCNPPDHRAAHDSWGFGTGDTRPVSASKVPPSALSRSGSNPCDASAGPFGREQLPRARPPPSSLHRRKARCSRERRWTPEPEEDQALAIRCKFSGLAAHLIYPSLEQIALLSIVGRAGRHCPASRLLLPKSKGLSIGKVSVSCSIKLFGWCWHALGCRE